MNWLQELFLATESEVNHTIAAIYRSSDENRYKILEGFGLQITYPPNHFNRICSFLTQGIDEMKMIEYSKNENIDAVHFHFGNVALRFEKILNKLNCKKFISLYGFDYELLIRKNPETLNIYRKLAKGGANFIVEGRYSKKLVESYGIPTSQIYIVEMFFQRALKPAYIPWIIPIRLMQAATYTEKKGQLILLEALSRLRESQMFIVDLYGEVVDPNYYKELKHILKINKLNSVNLNPKITLNLYIEKLKNSHVVASLSKHTEKGDSEGGCPVIIKDSFSVGKPVLTTDHCDIPDIAIHQYNAWLVKENCIHQAKEALQQLTRISERKYLHFCKSAWETAIEKLQSEWTRSCLLQAYQNGK